MKLNPGAKCAVGCMLYLPALAADLLAFCWIDLLNAAFWAAVLHWWFGNPVTSVIGFIVAFTLTCELELFEQHWTVRLLKWVDGAK